MNNILSVILPTYNRASCIKNSIDSVLKQSWDGNIELIIVDDCSTDNTKAIIDHYMDLPNVKYIANESNIGGAASRNVGVQHSSGQYISFIDSDVVWSPNKLNEQMKEIYQEPNKIIFCQYEKQHKEKWIKMPTKYSEGYIFDDLIYQNFVDTPSAIMTKDAFLSVGGFDEKLPRFQDWDLFLRLSEKYEFKCVNNVLFRSYTLENSITSNHKARLLALTILVEKYQNYLLSKPKLFDRFVFKLINANLILDDFDSAINMANKFISLSRMKKKLIVLGILFLKLLPCGIYKKIYEIK